MNLTSQHLVLCVAEEDVKPSILRDVRPRKSYPKMPKTYCSVLYITIVHIRCIYIKYMYTYDVCREEKSTFARIVSNFQLSKYLLACWLSTPNHHPRAILIARTARSFDSSPFKDFFPIPLWSVFHRGINGHGLSWFG